jgi:hypothetical protein
MARCGTCVRSLRFDFRRADHLPPLFSERDNEAAELSRRTGKRLPAEIGYPGGQFWGGEASIQLVVESVDNRCQRAHRRANSLVATCLIVGDNFEARRIAANIAKLRDLLLGLRTTSIVSGKGSHESDR